MAQANLGFFVNYKGSCSLLNEIMSRKQIDNAISYKKKTYRQTLVNKTQHRTLRTEQHEHHHRKLRVIINVPDL